MWYIQDKSNRVKALKYLQKRMIKIRHYKIVIMIYTK